jgi:hypothetical protein
VPYEHAESTAGPVHFEVAGTERPATDAGLRSRPILESQQLSAWYGHRKAIDSITLPMARHRITAIIGPIRMRQEHVPALRESPSIMSWPASSWSTSCHSEMPNSSR